MLAHSCSHFFEGGIAEVGWSGIEKGSNTADPILVLGDVPLSLQARFAAR